MESALFANLPSHMGGGELLFRQYFSFPGVASQYFFLMLPCVCELI